MSIEAPEGGWKPAVKKLEWSVPAGNDTLRRAETVVGIYRVWTHFEANGEWFWSRSADGGFARKNWTVATLAEGLAAAQADFEARILSALSISPAEAGDDWRDDPSADERWNAGLDYGLGQLCAVLGIDTASVNWDTATETLEGDVRAVICNIMRYRYGEMWSGDGHAWAEVSEIEEMFAAGQGDDDGPQILPDLSPAMSTSAKVQACLFLLERRRDAIEGFTLAAAEAGDVGEPVAWPQSVTKAQFQAAQRVFEKVGLDFRAPWDCDLDDAEQELFEALENALSAVLALATPPNPSGETALQEPAAWRWRDKRSSKPNDWLLSTSEPYADLPEGDKHIEKQPLFAAPQPADTALQERVKQLEEAFDFAAYLARERAWSEETFGPHFTVRRNTDHIRKELVEIEADPHDLEEWIDVVILALDGAWRAGHSPDAVISMIEAKQAKNEARRWPDWRTADPNVPAEHIREDAPALRVGGA